MSEAPTPHPSPNAPKLTVGEREPRRVRLRRYGRWALKWALRAVVVALVVGLLVLRGFYYAGQRGLRAEEARLDAEDPGWRAEDLIAARNNAVPSDEQNSARVVQLACARVPREWHESHKLRVLGNPWELNRKQTFGELLAHREGTYANMREPRELALTLADLPTGATPLPVDATVMTRFDQLYYSQCAAALLQVEVLDAATRDDARRALRAARAMVNAGRSLGECPTAPAARARYNIAMIATECAIRALAQCESVGTEDELATLQAVLARELEEPILVHALRGERALALRTFADAENRTPDPDKGEPEFDPSLAARADRFVGRSFLPEGRRRYLAGVTEIIAAAQGPLAHFRATVNEVRNRQLVRFDSRYQLGALMPDFDNLAIAATRHRAELGSAVVLLACERFRLKHGRFPNALAELTKELLTSVPLDPYTGAPLTFARTPDGIAVLAHPTNAQLPRQLGVSLTAPLGGDEFGWRLFDPKHRGLPPLPKPEPEPAPELP